MAGNRLDVFSEVLNTAAGIISTIQNVNSRRSGHGGLVVCKSTLICTKEALEYSTRGV